LERFEIQTTAGDGLGQMPPVNNLLPTEPRALKLCLVEREETRGRERRSQSRQAFKCGSGRSERHLLFQNDVQQRRKARLTKPRRRRAELCVDAREVWIARGQLAQSFTVRTRVQNFQFEFTLQRFQPFFNREICPP
jgi:hypothetical protein